MSKSFLDCVCQPDDDYKTPYGYYDTPFIYSQTYFFNDNDPRLTIQNIGGFNVKSLFSDFRGQVSLDGDSDFIVRRAYIAGMNWWNVFDAVDYPYFQVQQNSPGVNAMGQGLTYNLYDIPVLPEKLYPRGGAIKFLVAACFPLEAAGSLSGSSIPILLNFDITQPPFPSPAVYYFTVVFQGVKRYKGFTNRQPDYPYWERPFTQVLNFNLNWWYLKQPFNAYQPDMDRTFSVPVLDYDFELMAVEAAIPQSVTAVGPVITTNRLAFQLFDPARSALSSDFVPLFFGAPTPIAADKPQPQFGQLASCFPVPSIVYPANSAIYINIRSFADAVNQPNITTQPLPVRIQFKGVRRERC